jgi:energy-coupling factor transport system substrate-specific component
MSFLQKRLKLTLSEVVFITVMSTAMGIFWWAYTFLYNILAPFLKIAAADGLLKGMWLMGGVFFPYIIRKPGSAILGEGIASLVECLISQWGIGAIVYGVIQGVPVELFFLLLRYKKWNMLTILTAGSIAAIAEFILSIFWYQYYRLGISYNMIQLTTCAISGIILAGWLSKVLADKLVKTGVLNHFNIVRQSIKSTK